MEGVKLAISQVGHKAALRVLGESSTRGAQTSVEVRAAQSVGRLRTPGKSQSHGGEKNGVAVVL